MKTLKIKRTLFPDGNKKYIVVGKSLSKYGICEGRIFKGTRKECEEFIQRKNKERSIF